MQKCVGLHRYHNFGHSSAWECDDEVCSLVLIPNSVHASPEVELCGYSIPHPSEAKMNIRIQTYGSLLPVRHNWDLLMPEAREMTAELIFGQLGLPSMTCWKKASTTWWIYATLWRKSLHRPEMSWRHNNKNRLSKHGRVFTPYDFRDFHSTLPRFRRYTCSGARNSRLIVCFCAGAMWELFLWTNAKNECNTTSNYKIGYGYLDIFTCHSHQMWLLTFEAKQGAPKHQQSEDIVVVWAGHRMLRSLSLGRRWCFIFTNTKLTALTAVIEGQLDANKAWGRTAWHDWRWNNIRPSANTIITISVAYHVTNDGEIMSWRNSCFWYTLLPLRK